MSIASLFVGLVNPLAGGALALAGKAKSMIGGAVAWLFKNPLAALCIGLAIFGAYEWHVASLRGHRAERETAIAKAERAAHLADNQTWAKVNAVNHDSAVLLIGAIGNQTAAIQRWSTIEAKRQNAAKAAQQAAQAQIRQAHDLAAHLDAERAQRAATGLKCAEGTVAQSMKGKW